MEAWLTREWQHNSPWQIFLRPVSWLFRLLVALRRRAYQFNLFKSSSVGVPVIVVGNISVGGTGKTPLVLALVDMLTRRGMHCGIVTRGYNRRADVPSEIPIHITPNLPPGSVISDEATLLARRAGVPVYASANRVEAAEALLRNHGDVDVIISDDGLQHYALRRDIEICVIDGARGLGNGALLPAGPLREPASRLNAVDAIVVNGNAIHPEIKPDRRGREWPQGPIGRAVASPARPSTPRFDMMLANETFINLQSDRRLEQSDALAAFHGKHIHALAGIGNPQRFFSHLAALGLELGTTQPFPDHHDYRADDFSGVEAGIILMTEKDAVKCAAFADERMWFMQVVAVLPPDFADFILDKLHQHKA